MKICATLNSIVIGLTLTACAIKQGGNMGGESEFRDVFGIARAVSGTEQIPMPETEADWLIITNKIDNNQIDDSVLIATYSNDWPNTYNKTEIRKRYNYIVITRALDGMKGMTTGTSLPSGRVSNKIWETMLEEIAEQQARKKTEKE